MEDIVEAFTEKTKIQCDLVVSSSGKLTAQINEGAPFDVFISADMKYPESIYQDGLAEDRPEIFAEGKLVLWTLDESIKPILASLTNERIQTVAIPNPKTAPYGQAAIEALKSKNIYEKVKHKLVYGSSVSQSNQFILSESADIGFTALSAVKSNKLKETGSWKELPSNSYHPIQQGAVIVKQNGNSENAKQFYDFLFSKEAQSILINYGYQVNVTLALEQ